MFVHSFVRLGKEFFGSCHLIVKIKPDDLMRLNVTSFLFVHSQYSNVFPTFIHDLKPLIISILLILHNRRLFHLKEQRTGLTRMPETLKLAPKNQTVTNFNDGWICPVRPQDKSLDISCCTTVKDIICCECSTAVEHLSHNQEVVGSNPAELFFFFIYLFLLTCTWGVSLIRYLKEAHLYLWLENW